MKIRVMGTKDECELATQYYSEFEKQPFVKSVQISRLYANRGSNTIFRVYIDIETKEEQLYLLKR